MCLSLKDTNQRRVWLSFSEVDAGDMQYRNVGNAAAAVLPPERRRRIAS
jgi:hypothetical protein